MSDRNSGFIPIEDHQAGLKILRDACRLSIPTKIWLKDHGELEGAHLSGFDFNQNRFQVVLSEKVDFASLQTGLSRDPFLYLSFNIHGLSIFVKAGHEQTDAPLRRMSMRLPEIVYRTQQRKHPRAIVRHRQDIQLLHPDPMNPGRILSRRVNDLSMGGASIILFYGEERHYHVRQRLEAIELVIDGKSIQTWGIVRHLAVFPQDSDTQGIKLGVEFFNLGPQDQSIISNLVDLELRQQFQSIEGKS